jgi:tetratricopeptide (TPR) repeat protein
MRSAFRSSLLFSIIAFMAGSALSQASQICSDTGGASVWLTSKVVYGIVKVTGSESAVRTTKVTISLTSGSRTVASANINESGTYCFRDIDGSGATLILEVEGREVGRETLETVPGNAPKQFRRDFEIEISGTAAKTKPGVVSAKYPYTRSEKQEKLYADAGASISRKDLDGAEKMLRKIVEADKGDFWAWAKLGTIYLERNNLADAETSLRSSLRANPEFVPAAINLGNLYLIEKKYDQAIETLATAAKNDPEAARVFQLLGEAYILAQKEALGIEALYKAILLEPDNMADSHLLLAWVFDRAGDKKSASREYKTFLEKKPDHPDAKKFAQYIKDNPEAP